MNNSNDNKKNYYDKKKRESDSRKLNKDHYKFLYGVHAFKLSKKDKDSLFGLNK